MEALRANWVALSANVAVCSFGLGLSLLVILQARRFLILPATVIAYVLTNGLFAAVPLFVPVDVPFPTAPVIYHRLAIANAIFVGTASAALFLLAVRLRRTARRPEPALSLPSFLPLSMCLLGSLFMAYFLARNPEIIDLSPAIYLAQSYDGYIVARNAVGEVVASRAASGNGLLLLAFSFIFPATLALIPHAAGLRRGLRRVIQAWAWLGMLLAAAAIGSRMMWLYAIIFPIVLWWLRRVSGRSLIQRLQSFLQSLLTWGAVILAGAAVFQAAVQTRLDEAIFLLFARTFVAPGAVSGGYLMLFPEFFPFRGAGGIFMMPIASDTVDFSMISIASTGIDSHANASFIATAYSAAGFGGVALVSVVTAVVAFVIDSWLQRLPRRFASLVVIANAFGILMLCSVPFRVAAVTNGYLVGPALLLVLSLVHHQLARRPAPAPSIVPA
jgi:hypothetical protein